MLLVYTPKVTERVRYTFKLVLGQLLGVEYKLTDALESWQEHLGAKIAYGPQPIEEDGLWFQSHDLLFERGIHEQKIHVFDFETTKAFFKTKPDSALPFDIFAASFYLVSRYEEYEPFIRDMHGRFTAEQSIALKEGFLHQPVVNIWAMHLHQKLQKAFPNISFDLPEYRYIPTYDIDIAWAYLHKGLLRIAGGYLSSIAKFQLNDIWYRTTTLLKLRTDPYYTFDYLKQLQQQYNLSPIYFFLVGEYDKYDKNIAIAEPAYQKLIKHVADYARVGVHPSYGSNDKQEQVTVEKERIEEIIKRPVVDSRQHYLKFSFPKTFQHLSDLDITDDYSLGYTSHAGFRAGICTPFYFYNIHLEVQTPLRMHPFAIMDSVYQYYLQIPPEEMLDHARPVIDSVKAVGGALYTLWHNNSLSDIFEWKGWRPPYEALVRYAR